MRVYLFLSMTVLISGQLPCQSGELPTRAGDAKEFKQPTSRQSVVDGVGETNHVVLDFSRTATNQQSVAFKADAREVLFSNRGRRVTPQRSKLSSDIGAIRLGVIAHIDRADWQKDVPSLKINSAARPFAIIPKSDANDFSKELGSQPSHSLQRNKMSFSVEAGRELHNQ